VENIGVLNQPKYMKIVKSIHQSVLLLTLTVIYFLAIPPAKSAPASEPAYNGKGLSEWLSLSLTAEPSAEDAVRQIGTNGIPNLIDMLGVKESNQRRVLAKLKSQELQQAYHDKRLDLDDVRNLAVEGFAILGTNAESAIPQITKLFHDEDICLEAARALTRVGPKGFVALTNAMNDEDLAGAVVYALGQHNSGDPKAITQVLVCALKNPDPGTRGNAARFLAGKDATVAVPALIPLLDDKEPYVLNAAIMALGSYGVAAKDAAPKLFSIFTNAMFNPDLRQARTMYVAIMPALNGMDREMAVRAGEFIVNNGPLGACESYTATLLPNGKRLIAGGFIQTTVPTVSNHVFSSAKLLDPTTGKWEDTGSMNEARGAHTATLLRNGKLLVAGGIDVKGNRLSSAELYDPTTGKWTETGSMNAASVGVQAVLQPNGKVRVPAYYEGDMKRPGDNLYDPVTRTWSVITDK
jgi:HEAT repeats/Galactose oxidase, central domain